MQSSLDALAKSGPASAAIGWLGRTDLGLGAAIWLIVLAVILAALLRRRSVTHESRAVVTVVSATILTALLLFGLAFASYATDHHVQSGGGNRLSVHIDGRQFWWMITYNDSNPSRRVTTANELVIPVGRTVEVSLTSHDVIHSFWAPAVQGKFDLVPGYTTLMTLRVDSAGVYQGKCAEFCGDQHAKMKFLVIALPQDRFAVWY